MRARWSRRQRLKNDLIFVVALAASKTIGRLPRTLLVTLGALLGSLGWLVAIGARRIARSNIDRVFADRPIEWRRALVRRSFVTLGRLLGDAVSMIDDPSPANRHLRFDDDARQIFVDALADGRGCILITAHLGPWERLAAVIVESGLPLVTPVRVSYDPRLQARIMAPLRERRGVQALDREHPSTTTKILRALRRGSIAGFLIDVDTRVASIEAPFLGTPARTPSGAARIALRTGAPVVVAIASEGGVVAKLLRPASEPVASDVEAATLALTTAMNDALGEAILREPERWIWPHDRWKNAPPEATQGGSGPV